MRPSMTVAVRTATPDASDVGAIVRDVRVRAAFAVMLLLVLAAAAVPGPVAGGEAPTLAGAVPASIGAWRATFGPALIATTLAWALGATIGIVVAATPRAVRDVFAPALRGIAAIALLLLVLAAMAITGIDHANVIGAIAGGQCVRYARNALAIAERERAQPYVEAARGLALPAWHVWRRHVLPNCASRVLLLPLAGPLRSAAAVHATIAFLGLAPGAADSLGGVIGRSLSPAHAAGAAVLLCVSLLALNVLAGKIGAFEAGRVAR